MPFFNLKNYNSPKNKLKFDSILDLNYQKNGKPIEKSIIKKGLEYGPENHINTNRIELYRKLTQLMQNITESQTHVLIATESIIDLIIYGNTMRHGTHIFHVSTNKYYYRANGFVFNRNLDQFIGQKFNDM